MKLQILIPQYKETDDVIRPLLDSIAFQQNVDFNEVSVIICNDGSDVFLSDELLRGYPFVIEYYREPHRGVSATRNACLDRARAEYVMFCDADDQFSSVTGLWTIFDEIYKEFDTLTSCFTEEVRTRFFDESIYKNREHDVTFVHGKVHRRQYLLDNDIRFNDSLTIHEDSYFNILCQSLTDNIVYVDTPFYLWKYRHNSICRGDPKYLLKTWINMIDSNDALVDALYNRGIADKALRFVAHIILESYYRMNKPEWTAPENTEYYDATVARLAEYYRKHRVSWESMAVKDKMQISQDIRCRLIKEGMHMETITFDEWLKRITYDKGQDRDRQEQECVL